MGVGFCCVDYVLVLQEVWLGRWEGFGEVVVFLDLSLREVLET